MESETIAIAEIYHAHGAVEVYSEGKNTNNIYNLL